MNKFSIAKECFSYAPETGEFFWRERPRDHFSTDTAHIRFNSNFAGSKVYVKLDKDGYRILRATCHTLPGRRLELKAHRVAWFLHFGEEPAQQIDHINRECADNRISNLRLVSPSINQRNKGLGKNNKSGASGVRYRRDIRRWCAEIGVTRKTICLGYFATFHEALEARSAAESRFGFLNQETRRAV